MKLKITGGDINAFWALTADNLANLIIISGVCTGLFHMPGNIVFGRILPGIGMALLLGLSYYAWLAIRLAKRTGRDDVTALPYGVSTPVLFVYLFAVIGPVYFKTKNPVTAWQVGMAAAFIGGIIEASGSLIGPWVKKVTPRAAMLGTLGGIAIVWIATVPFAEIFEHPIIGFVSLAIILAGLVARVRLPFGIPAGLAAIIVGAGIGFFTGDSSIDVSGIGLYTPVLAITDLFSGLKAIIHDPWIFTIILPIEVYNFLETMNNVESAEAAGDSYSVGWCQLIDGLGTMTGALFGSAFPTTVYIGQPAYKKLGARWGYAMMVGATFLLITVFGVVTMLYKLIPMAAVAPMLVFVGIVILAQAFTASPVAHAPAVAIAIVPHIADILGKQVHGTFDTTMQFLSGHITEPLTSLKLTVHGKLANSLVNTAGIHFPGYALLSSGAIVTGLIWGAVLALLIDKKFGRAGHFASVGLVLASTGFIHADKIAFLPHPRLAIGYLIMAVFFYLLYFWKRMMPVESRV